MAERPFLSLVTNNAIVRDLGKVGVTLGFAGNGDSGRFDGTPFVKREAHTAVRQRDPCVVQRDGLTDGEAVAHCFSAVAGADVDNGRTVSGAALYS